MSSQKWNDFEVILTDGHICFTPNVLKPEEDDEQEDDIYVNCNEVGTFSNIPVGPTNYAILTKQYHKGKKRLPRTVPQGSSDH